MPDNTALIQSLYQAFAAGDVPTVIDTLDPAIQWNEAESFIYADGNPYIGPQAVLTGVFMRIGADFDGFQAIPEKFLSDGDTVAAFGRYRGKYKMTGGSVDAQFVHVFTLTNGKVTAFQQYTDTAQFQKVVSGQLTASA
jgi:ketosteroid isomerase-like protein